ncbi:Exonuclease III [Rubritalea squalenifaciens DSM 18772]|uniref:Exonuclease III n=1 Tax=Rubritalea squalenifaciens DSM 18772 TaxID=1123071 RepID=A0A1M6EKU4_9BACT|nr:endonuclease/exonuclease/phosphatase family protein [Rubritalea squalenifaciens]SHI85908.1 Exonuclease III [Rubritalea squalenifaciens DSM 18772]
MKTKLITMIGGCCMLSSAVAQTLTLDSSSYTEGQSITASWTNGPGDGQDWVGVYPSGVTPGNQAASEWLYIGGSQTSKNKGPKNGSVTFNNPSLTSGTYSAYYLSNDTYTVLSGPINFSVTQGGGQGNDPAITTSKASYAYGETITVNFSNGPGNTNDWIGLYNPGVTPAQGSPSLTWKYTGGATSGSVDFPNPGLQPGNYVAYFLENDGYNVLDGPLSFSVTGGAGPAQPEWVMSPFRRIHGIAGTAYSGKIGSYASDPDPGDTLSYSKVNGPAWLSIQADGSISGTPTTNDIGLNAFTVRATDLGGNTSDATMNIIIYAAGSESVSTLKVMSFNMWHGLGQINNGHRKGLEAIILADADIIGTQETVDNVSGSNVNQAQKIATDLGWHYYSGYPGIISRYPITEQSIVGSATRAKIKLTSSPLKEAILYNCHLDYLYYGPYEAHKQGSTAQKVLVEEKKSQRDEQIAAIISGMTSDINNAENIPVLLTGDFNAPSHLDWTEDTAPFHGGVGYVAWPTSLACTDAGLLDSFREVNPDPVLKPSNTWSPLFLGDAQDRIDFIYYKGSSLTPTSSGMFHTAIEETLGAWGSSITPALNNTWPSDHGAVLTTFTVQP